MTGRHAAADDIDDQALADELREPGAHRAPGEMGTGDSGTGESGSGGSLIGEEPVDPQGSIGDGSIPADADLQVEPTVPATRSGRRAAQPKGSPS